MPNPEGHRWQLLLTARLFLDAAGRLLTDIQPQIRVNKDTLILTDGPADGNLHLVWRNGFDEKTGEVKRKLSGDMKKSSEELEDIIRYVKGKQ